MKLTAQRVDKIPRGMKVCTLFCQLSVVSLDELVPSNHLVRKIEKAIDFTFIYDFVKDKYSQDNGRPSVDPVVLIKIVFIQYLFGIKSMRQTIKELETNVAYRL
ncbi:hypothetical protein P615_16560 [Brevibacillus laterosporus PE36]|nr:hypothetical protein P615_16560 [Brevibacillus laterosporus PE36]